MLRLVGARIIVEGLVFDGRHGLLPVERETGVRIRVDLELEMEIEAAARTDRLADTVDYRLVAEVVRAQVADHSYQLLERLTSIIADEILEHFPLIRCIDIHVRKLLPILAGHPESVGIRLRRERGCADPGATPS